jgi:hypothetical protein
VKLLQADKLMNQSNMTMTLDGWTNCCMHSIYAFMIILSDRSTLLLDSLDLSDISHTARKIAGVWRYN